MGSIINAEKKTIFLIKRKSFSIGDPKKVRQLQFQRLMKGANIGRNFIFQKKGAQICGTNREVKGVQTGFSELRG
jgi:hypothetical protein